MPKTGPLYGGLGAAQAADQRAVGNVPTNGPISMPRRIGPTPRKKPQANLGGRL